AGQLPALQLDNGVVISEVTTICEYLEDINGPSDLIGSDAEQRAQTRMWTRRIDLGFCEPMANGFRASEGRAIFENRMKLVSPEASGDLKALAQNKLDWLDEQLQGKEFVCGERFSLADIMLYAFVEFGGAVGQPLAPGHVNIKAWFDRVTARPSIAVSQ
ncbi:MAG: glutathione S-transferase, partial [Paraglaciecola psychrophila]